MASIKKSISVFGVSFLNADQEKRNRYYLSNEEYAFFLKKLARVGIKDVLVNNTMDGTEIYCMSDSIRLISDIYRKIKHIDELEFKKDFYTKNHHQTLNHFYEFISGLKSKSFNINFEVVQNAYRNSAKYGLSGQVINELISGANHLISHISENNQANKSDYNLYYNIVQTLKKLGYRQSDAILLIGADDQVAILIALLQSSGFNNLKVIAEYKSAIQRFEGITDINTGWFENIAYQFKQSSLVINTVDIESYVAIEQLDELDRKLIFELASNQYLSKSKSHLVYNPKHFMLNKDIRAQQLRHLNFIYKAVGLQTKKVADKLALLNATDQTEYDYEEKASIYWFANTKVLKQQEEIHGLRFNNLHENVYLKAI